MEPNKEATEWSKSAWAKLTRGKTRRRGPPGITINSSFHHVIEYAFRDEKGQLLGLLIHSLESIPGTPKGYTTVVVHPDHRRHGIGRALLQFATQRHDIEFAKQVFSEEGIALVNAVLKLA